VTYPKKVSDADCLRIGTIGRIYPDVVQSLVMAIEGTLDEMGIILK
jgi:aspartate aminotransferase-like enzyme